MRMGGEDEAEDVVNSTCLALFAYRMKKTCDVPVYQDSLPLIAAINGVSGNI